MDNSDILGTTKELLEHIEDSSKKLNKQLSERMDKLNEKDMAELIKTFGDNPIYKEAVQFISKKKGPTDGLLAKLKKAMK